MNRVLLSREEHVVSRDILYFDLQRFGLKMAFILRRCLSTSARRFQQQSQQKFVMAIPAPLTHTPALETAELQQLARKAQGSWKELSNDEVVKCKCF